MEIKQTAKKYYSNHSIVYSCQYHVIWCTKYRRSVLDEQIQKELKRLILSKQKEYGFTSIELETMPDHVHLLMDHNPQNDIVSTVGKIKGFTSHELREKFPQLKSKLPTLWTRSKFVSTVGAVTLEAVKRYIEAQKGV